MMLGQKEWHAHAQLVGRVTLAWNNNVHQLLRIFCHLTGFGSPLAEAIFFSPQSDQAQRVMIKRVAKAVGLDDTSRIALEKLLKRLEKVSTGRNLATHTIFGLSLFDPNNGNWGVTVVPALSPQDKRLQQDFTGQFRKAEADLASIYQELDEWLIKTPFPARPWGLPMNLGPVSGYPEIAPAPDQDHEPWNTD